MKQRHENVILIHVTLIPYLKASQEMKQSQLRQRKRIAGNGNQPISSYAVPNTLDTGMKTKFLCSVICRNPCTYKTLM